MQDTECQFTAVVQCEWVRLFVLGRLQFHSQFNVYFHYLFLMGFDVLAMGGVCVSAKDSFVAHDVCAVVLPPQSCKPLCGREG